VSEPINLPDLGGGQNDGIPATAIKDNQMAELYNFIPYGTKLVRRPGVSKLTITPYAQNLNSVTALKESTGVWTVMVGHPLGLARLSGQELVTLPISEGTVFPSYDDPWDFHQYNSIGYAMRRGVGLKRFTHDYMQSAGLAPLTAAPTLADGGAGGSIEAGTYYSVVTRFNSLTGAESNPSPRSGAVTIVANHKINWTWTDVETGQWDSYRLYRTLPNQLGEYFFVYQTLSPYTLSYVDNVVQNDLGSSVSFDNGLPPTGLLYGDLFKERMFASDGIDVFFSEYGLPEAWAEDSIIPVFTDDGHQIRSVRAYGDRVVVGKTNKVHYIVATGPRSFSLQTLSDKHGCWSHKGMKVAEGHLFWPSSEDFYRSDGSSTNAIGNTKIRKLMERVPEEQRSLITAEIYEPRNLYIASIPLDGSTTNRAVVAYNYKTDAWTAFDHPADSPNFVSEIFNTNYGKQIYATFGDGHLYQYLTGNDDFGTAINARLKTKAFQNSKPGLAIALRRLHVLSTTLSRPLTIKIYRNGSTIPYKTRVVQLDTAQGWKVYSASNLNDPAGTIQVGIEYTGDSELELEALSLEVAEFMRFVRAA
jgi:hypothetical protein